MKEMIVFLVDEGIELIDKDNAKCFKMKDAVSKGMVVDRVKFIENFQRILKKEKIKSKLLGDNIRIVKNVFYNERDIFYLESVFSELGFMKVLWLEIKSLLPDMDATFIEVNNSYMVVHLDKGVYLDLDLFKDIPKILGYFKDSYKSDVVLFGKNKNIPNIKVLGVNIYYLDLFDEYMTKSLLKVKKYGV